MKECERGVGSEGEEKKKGKCKEDIRALPSAQPSPFPFPPRPNHSLSLLTYTETHIHTHTYTRPDVDKAFSRMLTCHLKVSTRMFNSE